jgi:choline dehydrogenase-like flavoprotein
LQELNGGAVVGHPYVDLRTASLRQFGGTTNHWTAWVEPFDPIDFEARPWVPDSGWPVDRTALQPFYDRAAQFLRLGEHPFDVAAWERTTRAGAWQVDGLNTQLVRIVAPQHRRLGPLLHDSVHHAGNITVYLHATVLELVPDPDVRRVTHLRVRTGAGTEITVRARRFVLATGGIENARRLLLSSSVQRAGLGNGHDLVGRYFANHPALTLDLHLQRPDVGTPLYAPPPALAARGHATLTLAPAWQREHKLLNLQCHPWLLGTRPGAVPRDTQGMTPAAHLAWVTADLARLAAGAVPQTAFLRTLTATVIAETSPEPTSRVRLGDERDAFGQPRVVLDWRTRKSDPETIRLGVRVLAGALGAAGIARVSLPADALQFNGSFHHLGTTRMHTDPRRGVVDAHCRVHGLDNLFVAGSSVFPTYGTVNPTFTIIALAFRLAAHLKGLRA